MRLDLDYWMTIITLVPFFFSPESLWLVGIIVKHEGKTVIYLLWQQMNPSQALTEQSQEIVPFVIFVLLWLRY